MSISAHAQRYYRQLLGERRAHRTGGRRRTDFEPNQGWAPVLALAIPIALLDWGVKWLIVQNVALHEFQVWSDRVALWHVKNPALVLGLHGDLPVGMRKALVTAYGVLAVMLLIAVFGRAQRLLPNRRKWVWIFLGMVGGGMLGNLGERTIHWGVTDYLSFRWGDIWLPPGNVADLSILLALPLALMILAFELEARSMRAPAGRSALEPEVTGPRSELPSL